MATGTTCQLHRLNHVTIVLYDQLSDRDLINTCLSGDNRAWDALVERYQRLVYTVPTRYGLNPSEIDDVFQSVWLSLIRNLDSLREPDRVAAWLVTTARRECWERRRGADYERTVAVSPEGLSAGEQMLDMGPEELVAKFNRHEMVRNSVKDLDQDCQDLLWQLYYSESKPSYAEIARRLGMPIGSIGPKRARCLKKLKEIVEKLG